MNRREFFRLVGTFIAGTMIQPNLPVRWFSRPPARSAPEMPTTFGVVGTPPITYILVDSHGELIPEGDFNYLSTLDCPMTLWTVVHHGDGGWVRSEPWEVVGIDA